MMMKQKERVEIEEIVLKAKELRENLEERWAAKSVLYPVIANIIKYVTEVTRRPSKAKPTARAPRVGNRLEVGGDQP